MPVPVAVPIAMAIGSAISSYLANRKKTQTTMPSVSKELQPLQNQLIQMAMERINSPTALPKGYETGQIGNINTAFDLIGQSQANNLTARGLGTSPVAGAVDAARENNRAGQIVKMQQTLPLLEKQLRDSDLAWAQSLLGLGAGQTTTTSGNALGSAASSLMDILAFYYGQGMLGGGGTGQTIADYNTLVGSPKIG